MENQKCHCLCHMFLRPYNHLASSLLVLHHGEHPAPKESSAVLACTYWYRSQTTAQYLYPHFAKKKLIHKEKLFDIDGRIRICLLMLFSGKILFFFLQYFFSRTTKLRLHISQLFFDKKPINLPKFPYFLQYCPLCNFSQINSWSQVVKIDRNLQYQQFQ